MHLDYLIVGQGIAGTNLAFTLLNHGKTIKIVDQPQPFSSSRAAAGLFNPITGRKLTKTWLADQFFPFLHQFYPKMEKLLGEQFFYQNPIYIPFDSVEKQNTWIAKSAEETFQSYILKAPSKKYEGLLNTHFGGMELKQSGYVDTNVYLDAAAVYFSAKGLLASGKVLPSDISLHDGGISWQGIQYKKVIFCDGAANAENGFFDWLDYRRVKGEILRIRFQHGGFDQIVNRGCWLIPLPDQSYKVGSTFDFRQLDTIPTEKGKSQVLEKLEALVNLPYEIVDHWAGIRPATYDRRPFIGLHPEYPQIALFNGMGSKGISMTPFLAEHFYEFLELGKTLMPELELNRKQRKQKK